MPSTKGKGMLGMEPGTESRRVVACAPKNADAALRLAAALRPGVPDSEKRQAMSNFLDLRNWDVVAEAAHTVTIIIDSTLTCTFATKRKEYSRKGVEAIRQELERWAIGAGANLGKLALKESYRRQVNGQASVLDREPLLRLQGPDTIPLAQPARQSQSTLSFARPASVPDLQESQQATDAAPRSAPLVEQAAQAALQEELEERGQLVGQFLYEHVPLRDLPLFASRSEGKAYFHALFAYICTHKPPPGDAARHCDRMVKLFDSYWYPPLDLLGLQLLALVPHVRYGGVLLSYLVDRYRLSLIDDDELEAAYLKFVAVRFGAALPPMKNARSPYTRSRADGALTATEAPMPAAVLAVDALFKSTIRGTALEALLCEFDSRGMLTMTHAGQYRSGEVERIATDKDERDNMQSTYGETPKYRERIWACSMRAAVGMGKLPGFHLHHQSLYMAPLFPRSLSVLLGEEQVVDPALAAEEEATAEGILMALTEGPFRTNVLQVGDLSRLLHLNRNVSNSGVLATFRQPMTALAGELAHHFRNGSKQHYFVFGFSCPGSRTESIFDSTLGRLVLHFVLEVLQVHTLPEWVAFLNAQSEAKEVGKAYKKDPKALGREFLAFARRLPSGAIVHILPFSEWWIDIVHSLTSTPTYEIERDARQGWASFDFASQYDEAGRPAAIIDIELHFRIAPALGSAYWLSNSQAADALVRAVCHGVVAVLDHGREGDCSFSDGAFNVAVTNLNTHTNHSRPLMNDLQTNLTASGRTASPQTLARLHRMGMVGNESLPAFAARQQSVLPAGRDVPVVLTSLAQTFTMRQRRTDSGATLLSRTLYAGEERGGEVSLLHIGGVLPAPAATDGVAGMLVGVVSHSTFAVADLFKMEVTAAGQVHLLHQPARHPNAPFAVVERTPGVPARFAYHAPAFLVLGAIATPLRMPGGIHINVALMQLHTMGYRLLDLTIDQYRALMAELDVSAATLIMAINRLRTKHLTGKRPLQHLETPLAQALVQLPYDSPLFPDPAMPTSKWNKIAAVLQAPPNISWTTYIRTAPIPSLRAGIQRLRDLVSATRREADDLEADNALMRQQLGMQRHS